MQEYIDFLLWTVELFFADMLVVSPLVGVGGKGGGVGGV